MATTDENTASATRTTEQPTEQHGMFHSLSAYRGFRLLFLGTMATNSAFWMYQIAVGWLALQETDSPLFVGLTGFAGGIPLLIFAIPSGVVIDRVDRRTVLMIAQASIMVVASAFAIMIATDAIRPWSILALAFVYGTIMSFVFPTRNAIVPNLVAREDLVNAVALNAAGQNSTRVVGPSLAGVLIAIVGVSGTFAVAAAMQILALLWTAQLPKMASDIAVRSSSLWRNVTEGIEAVARDEFLKGMILLAGLVTILVMPYINLMPVFARDEMHLGATGLGALMACSGTGSVLGALAVARWRALGYVRGIQVWSAIAFAAFVIVFAFTSITVAAGLLLFVAGLVSASYLAINQTVLQLRIDDAVRGRVLSIYLLTWGMLPLGQLPIGALADRIGAPAATAAACALAILLFIGMAIRYPSLRD
ncbi:MAG: MFS transporter [Thermomicrobiales bacterium]|jgi:MFS family permease|nr:MFS transporter [Thermomicrobiales bacterium]